MKQIEAVFGRCSSKKVFVKISQISSVLEYLLNKVAGLRTCNVIKKRLQHRCLPVKFAIFSRKPPVVASEKTQEIFVVHCVAKLCSGHYKSILVFQYDVKRVN